MAPQAPLEKRGNKNLNRSFAFKSQIKNLYESPSFAKQSTDLKETPIGGSFNKLPFKNEVFPQPDAPPIINFNLYDFGNNISPVKINIFYSLDGNMGYLNFYIIFLIS